MGLNTQIQLGNKGYLTIADDVAVPLNFSIAEIQDISKRQGSYSKTIILPGTPNNNKLLGNIFDTNISYNSFNPNKREECSILSNGVPVFNGFLQLLNITKSSPNSETQDEQVSYEVMVRDDSGAFFQALDDGFLEDLTGFDQYNHIYTLNSITDTRGNTAKDVYKYHLTYNLKTDYNLTDFAPNIFAKVYWDKIWNEAGYSYTWDSLEAEDFDKLIVPYNGDKPLPNLNKLATNIGFSGNNFTNLDIYTGNGKLVNYINEVTPPYSDENNAYSAGSYTAKFNGQVTFKTRYDYSIIAYFPVDTKLVPKVTIVEIPLVGGGTKYIPVYGDCKLQAEVQHHIGNFAGQNYELPLTNGGIIYDKISFSSSTSSTFYTQGFHTLQIQILSQELETTRQITVGQHFENWLTGRFILDGTFQPASYDFTKTPDENIILGNILDPVNYPQLFIDYGTTDTTFNYFKAIPTAELGENMDIILKNFIPKKIKKKDFIKAILNKFNLYLTPNPNLSKNIIIQTRDEFYDSGKEIDWSEKFVSDNETKIQVLPELQSKIVKFTYKQDSDAFNTNYFQQTNKIYGEKDFNFENDFVKDTKVIESLFSPTPLQKNGTGLLVPTIASATPKNNIRLLYDNDWISCNGFNWNYRSTPASTSRLTFSEYPFMCMEDNAINPTKSLCYGKEELKYYSDWQSETDNNLFNRYWKRYCNQIATGKLLTGKFRLTEKDIISLDFRNKIFLYDQYWYLNKITDFNANANQLTTVELISIEEGVKFSPTYTPRGKGSIIDGGGKNNGLGNEATLATGGRQNSYGSGVGYTQILGYNNTIQAESSSSLIAGNNNDVGGTGNFIVGNDNIVKGNNVFAFGVNGQTISNNNAFVIGMPLITYVNFIDAGRDEILNPNSITKIVNFIDAGRDVIRGIGGNSIEGLINAGFDNII